MRSLARYLLLAAVCWICILVTARPALRSGIQLAATDGDTVAPGRLDSDDWRHTRWGWKKISRPAPAPWIPPVIHPVWWAAMLVLIVLAAMTWASSEWDWRRLAGKQRSRLQPPARNIH